MAWSRPKSAGWSISSPRNCGWYEMGVAPSTPTPLVLVAPSARAAQSARAWSESIGRLARVGSVETAAVALRAPLSPVVRGEVVALPLAGRRRPRGGEGAPQQGNCKGAAGDRESRGQARQPRLRRPRARRHHRRARGPARDVPVARLRLSLTRRGSVWSASDGMAEAPCCCFCATAWLQLSRVLDSGWKAPRLRHKRLSISNSIDDESRPCRAPLKGPRRGRMAARDRYERIRVCGSSG